MNAVQQLLTDHIDIWTAAETEKRSGRGRASSNASSVYGIKKLRALILELAVRGKLVPQDANDEPASELLKRIQIEKKELITKGKIKKDTLSPAITEHEKPFTLPHGWTWSRFGNALINRDAERIPVSSDDRQNRKGDFDYYGASGVIDKIDKYLFDKPLLLIGEDGANLINRSSPIAFIARGKYWVNNHAHVLDGISEDFLRYLELYINAIDLKPYVTGTAQPKMNQAKMNSIILALPPAKEQKRIVAKVDELMALCDQLETQHSDAADAHEQLVSHLLGTLTRSQSTADFNTNWQRIAAHFDTLFTTEASIDALKQTLLQLAVIGKLVAQDANDEPASELLKRVQVEKNNLVSEGKIKKGKPFPKIADDKKIYTKPLGWEIINFGEIMELISGQHLNPSEYFEKEENTSIPYITGPADFSDNGPIPTRHTRERRAIAFCGDILVTVKGSGVGKTNSVYQEELAISRQLMAVRPILVNISFIDKLLLTLAQIFQDSTVGIAIPGISREDVLHAQIALPPLAEQIRIVAKIDELMEMCCQLKTSITDANQQQKKLADVLVENAVMG
jgi:type I restriction enzyme S subunit